MKRGRVTVYPRTVKLIVDRPVPVEGLEEDDAGKLLDTVRAAVSETLESALIP